MDIFEPKQKSILLIECNCDPSGSENLQCNDNGECSCKAGIGKTDEDGKIIGGKCDSCFPTYFGSFPDCKG